MYVCVNLVYTCFHFEYFFKSPTVTLMRERRKPFSEEMMPKNKMVMLGAIDVLCGYCSTVMSTLFSVLIPMLQFSSTFCLSLSSNP